jgi:hypothetical protein
MNMLYDSDSFAVVHIHADAPVLTTAHEADPAPHMPRHGFEIVDKRTGQRCSR